ncbi:GNAT family N-acetyltransferase [Streptomyces sp. N2-109]|uniref:GNAT family N-acetyltransferase n=1 Tax=Streptomyces gossypii TaxID=2883101 RepID=A0ABT2K1E1_9ACTN|nr:GNAT family N-acetyltransferase [Streptomyces gossypii]MCT2593434.1 GNAT family N-acetyltransferase [Streptomyces gossypii]
MDDGTGRLLSCAVGRYTPRLLPSARTIAANVGEIVSVATDPDHRRNGYAHACTTAVMSWLAEHDVSDVRLRASPDGRPLYEGMGFEVITDVFMSWRPPPAT